LPLRLGLIEDLWEQYAAKRGNDMQNGASFFAWGMAVSQKPKSGPRAARRQIRELAVN
jgi:hypothetical protein